MLAHTLHYHYTCTITALSVSLHCHRHYTVTALSLHMHYTGSTVAVSTMHSLSTHKAVSISVIFSALGLVIRQAWWQGKWVIQRSAVVTTADMVAPVLVQLISLCVGYKKEGYQIGNPHVCNSH